MNLTDFPENSEQEKIRELLIFASEIEHKFNAGRARDIQPELIQKVIQISIAIRKKTRKNRLGRMLSQIENLAYATLDNHKTQDYYKNLRFLCAEIQSLKELE
ncbi:MAG: hypothetical protein AB1846_02900 [Chloroflexota bacterium]